MTKVSERKNITKEKKAVIEYQQSQLSKIEKCLYANGLKKLFLYLFLSRENKQNYKDKVEKINKINEQRKRSFNKKNIFEIRDYSLFYLDNNGKKRQILKNINLDIERKKVTTFIGPSGCGKSTLLRSLVLLNENNVITEGCVYFDNGTNIRSKKLSHLQLTLRVAMIFQKPCPFPLSIYENIAYGPRAHGVRDKEVLDKIVQEALIDAGLWEEVKNDLNKLSTTLSGGQQQRLCIARALAIKPEVILMDESTSGLDVFSVAKIESLIVRLKEKYTIIMITHSLEQAVRISDNTVFLFAGSIVESGPTKQIFMHPKDKRTRKYVSGRTL